MDLKVSNYIAVPDLISAYFTKSKEAVSNNRIFFLTLADKVSKKMKITIIGGGNMGGAIACGLAAGSVVNASDITVADLSDEALAGIREFDKRINVTKDNVEAVCGADMVIVAVKPWLLEQVLEGIREHMDYNRQSIVSIVAGARFDSLASMLENGKGVSPTMFRVIPNTAISIGQSVTFIAHRGASAAQIASVEAMLGELGRVFIVEEDMMAAGTSLASCGIAFVLKYMDVSMTGGMELGFTQDESREIVMQTVRGALEMLGHNGTMPQTEIDKVTTPGGITLKGLEAMKEAGFAEAVLAGLKKSK